MNKQSLAGVLAVVFALLISCAGPPLTIPRKAVEVAIPSVKVTLVAATDTLTLTSESGFELMTEENRITLGHTIHIKFYKKTIIITDKTSKEYTYVSQVALQPLERGNVIACRGKTYLGQLLIIPTKNSFSVLNKLNLETYLKGVLPLEMGIRRVSEYQSLKVQAVAARSYALYRLQETHDSALAADVLDQMYGGAGVHNSASDSAVDATFGEVLLYENNVVKAYYSSTCGGQTQTPAMVWAGDDPGCYSSVPDTMCTISRHYRWEEVWGRVTLDSILHRSLLTEYGDTLDTQSTLTNISLKGTLASGRADTLLITMGEKIFRIARDRMRWVLRRPLPHNPILRSSYITLESSKDAQGVLDSVRVSGRGNGHGVGMCQWGCIHMARQRYDYKDILKHFYPKTLLSKAY